MLHERRRYRRLPIQLPLICRDPERPDHVVMQTRTINVSTGGIYFETLADNLRAGQRLDLELTIPPGEGHFPYQGRVTAPARIIRVKGVAPQPDAPGLAHVPRVGVAATFDDSLKLSF